MSARGPFQDKPALRVEAVTLQRGERELARDLSFAAAAGDYVEIRGANGTGKTTLLRTIAGFLRPRAGRIVIEGAEEPALAIHYIGHQNGLKGAASVRAHVRYWARLFEQPCLEPAVIASLGLRVQANLPARYLSQGQARRLALARLVIGGRPILLLDEPAAGLDAEGRDLLAGIISSGRDQGCIVLAALHEPLGPTPSQAVNLGLPA
jgi:heme exporter protein A